MVYHPFGNYVLPVLAIFQSFIKSPSISPFGNYVLPLCSSANLSSQSFINFTKRQVSERFVEEEELLSRVEVTKDQQIQLFLETRAQGEGYG